MWKNQLLLNFLAIIGALAFCKDDALAQIIKDNTLGAESSIVRPQIINNQLINQIDGGGIRNNNLFHSFEQFSVATGSTAYFNNPANIQNIITRVTGNSISNIDGILRANGNANLYVLNPNGIVFGPNAALNIGGSFMASTATSLNFADGTKFSATNQQTTPLLTISTPIGLDFGATPGSIRNQSQASLDGAINNIAKPGLQVQTGKTLAIVGGDLYLEGGNLIASGGRIELGSVAGNSLVQINPINQGWSLGYQGVQNFQNIQMSGRGTIPSVIDVSGDGSGNIQIQGRSLLQKDGSIILANNLGSKPGGDLIVNTSESVELIGFPSSIILRSLASGNTGDLTINTKKLIVRDGAQIILISSNVGSIGKLTVNANDSVEISGGVQLQLPFTFNIYSGLFSATFNDANAGDIIINTGKLIVHRGGTISTQSASSVPFPGGKPTPATGNGGNLTVNASESVELIGNLANDKENSSLSTSSQSFGNAGNLNLTTGKLIVREGARISSSSINKNNLPNITLGKAGELNITADSVVLDNQGQISAETSSGKGGNITLQLQDFLLMRRQSQISTNAGTEKAGGDGGNITINAPHGLIAAPSSENSNITANAYFGAGGRIIINANSIFGFVQRDRSDLVRLLQTTNPDQLDPKLLQTSDITAFSQQNPKLNGSIQIYTPKIDPNKGLVQLPENLVDTSRQIVSECKVDGKIRNNSFVTSFRAGIPLSPTNLLMGDTLLADWIMPEPQSENRASNFQDKIDNLYINTQNAKNVQQPHQIVEAQGWIVDGDGKVHLVAEVPQLMPHYPTLIAGCQ